MADNVGQAGYPMLYGVPIPDDMEGAQIRDLEQRQPEFLNWRKRNIDRVGREWDRRKRCRYMTPEDPAWNRRFAQYQDAIVYMLHRRGIYAEEA